MKDQNTEIESKLPVKICKNCGTELSGIYCSNCGQRYMDGRFTLKESFLAIVNQVFNLERGIFFTIKEMTIRPGITIKRYLSKATIQYMHPFRFALVLATISALLTILSGTFEMGVIQMGGVKAEVGSAEDIEATKRIIETIKKYLTLIMLSSIPINALFSRLIYFKKKYHFAEHLILNSYAYGVQMALGLPFFLLFLLPNGVIIHSIISFFLYYGTFIWVYSRFFEEKIIVSLLKMILLTFMIVFVTIIVTSVGIVAFKSITG